MEGLEIRVSRRWLMALLIGITAALTVGNLLHIFLWNSFQIDFRELSWRFEMSGDTTVPTWFSSFILLIAAVLFHVIGRTVSRDNGPFTRHWHGLAVIFLLLSVDETAALHEASSAVLNVSTTGFFFYSWVILGLILVGAFTIAYWRFLWSQQPDLRKGLVIAAALYVGGALVLEMFNARTEFLFGAETLRYQLGTALEEFLEMAGILWLIHVLTGHLSTMTSSITTVASGAPVET